MTRKPRPRTSTNPNTLRSHRFNDRQRRGDGSFYAMVEMNDFLESIMVDQGYLPERDISPRNPKRIGEAIRRFLVDALIHSGADKSDT